MHLKLSVAMISLIKASIAVPLPAYSLETGRSQEVDIWNSRYESYDGFKK